jgi:hypothetical protein
MMRRLTLILGLLAGCKNSAAVECEQNGNCDLSPGGTCVAAPSGNQWCAYPDPACPSGYRYDDSDVGDGLASACVASSTGDAGVDGVVIDTPPDTGSPVDALNCPGSAPLQTGQMADLVLGQPNFTSSTANNPFRSGSSLSTPIGLFSEGGRLWISDSGNARTLQWNSLPAVDGQSANIAIGQTDLINTTAGTGQAQFAIGGGFIAKAGTKLVISDGMNNRVLIWNSIPTTNGQLADIVLGQTSFTTKASGTSASGMEGPTGVWTDGTHLIVADRFNHRVLIWNAFPTQNGAAADVVLGEASFGANPLTNPPTASSFRNPYGVVYDGSRLIVADQGNNRVLIWNGIPTTNNKAADLVLGQTGFDTDYNNAGAPYPQVNAIGMVIPESVFVDGCGSMYVCDTGNDRVLVYTHVPTTSGTAADAVVGKPTATTQPNASTAASASWMDSCTGVAVSGSSLFVGDSSFNRVLRFSLAR